MMSYRDESNPYSESSQRSASALSGNTGSNLQEEHSRDTQDFDQSYDQEEEIDGGLYYDDPDPEEQDEEEEPEEDEAADTAVTPSSATRRTPVAGPGQHVVQQGESLISLGHRYNRDPQQILDHPENRHLVDEGREVSILNPGDLVTLPEQSSKSVSGSTDQRHPFVYRRRFTILKMKFFGMEGPLADEPYRLQVGERQYQGRLDGDGRMEERIPADARTATIHIGANGEHVMDIGVGHLNPISEISGIQMRLNNLGYSCGREDGEVGAHTRAAIRGFQRDNDLNESGEIDDQTRDRLREIFGC